MLNSAQVFDLIEEIASTSSKNEKGAMVQSAAKDELFCRVLKYTYDPFKTYGVQKIPAYTQDHTEKEFDDQTWIILDALISRDLTGTAAQDAISGELHELSDKSAELFKRILRKDLRAGFSESTCNKAVKGLIPDFPYMRCCLPKDAKLQDFDWKLGVFSQEKADGMFANLDVEEGGVVRLTSRQGSPFPMEAFADFVEEAGKRLTPGTQSHGELLVRRNGQILAREIGNGILNSILSGGTFDEGDEPFYMIWDQIPLSAVTTKGKYDLRYINRLSLIMKQLQDTTGDAISLIPTRVVRNLADAYKHYGELLKVGKEGTIIKNPHAIWKDGTSKEQVKLKLEVDVDLKVVAIVPGREGTKNEGRAGSLTCVSHCGQLQVDVTVKNEAMRDRVDANPEDWIDRIIAVRANSIMQPSESNDLHSLFLPRMVEAEYRMDKTIADDLGRIKAQFESAIKVTE